MSKKKRTRKPHKNPKCKCYICKAKRGENKSEDNGMFGKKLKDVHGIDCKCPFCKDKHGINNPRYGIKLSQEIKNKISKSEQGKVIPLEVRKKMSKTKLETTPTGEKHWLWKGGKNRKSLKNKIRDLFEYRQWKEAVLKRDYPNLNYKDIKKNRLQVHHLIPLSEIIDKYNIESIEDAINCSFLWDVSNGISLRRGEHYLITQLERIKYPSKGFLKFIKHIIDDVFNKCKEWIPKISKNKGEK